MAGGGVVGEVLRHGLCAILDKAQAPYAPLSPFGSIWWWWTLHRGENVRTRGLDRPTTWEAVEKVPIHLCSPECWLEGEEPVTLRLL